MTFWSSITSGPINGTSSIFSLLNDVHVHVHFNALHQNLINIFLFLFLSTISFQLPSLSLPVLLTCLSSTTSDAWSERQPPPYSVRKCLAVRGTSVGWGTFRWRDWVMEGGRDQWMVTDDDWREEGLVEEEWGIKMTEGEREWWMDILWTLSYIDILQTS